MCTPERRRAAALAVALAVAPVPIAAAATGADAAPGATRDAAGADGTLPPTVFPDGTGLPGGGATAREGAAPYARLCAGCHGERGEGARAVELVGDPASLDGEEPDRGVAARWPYAAPLFDYVRRAMPPDAPWSLDARTAYAVVARVLELNGLVDADVRVDARLLGGLPMPNAGRFLRAER